VADPYYVRQADELLDMLARAHTLIPDGPDREAIRSALLARGRKVDIREINVAAYPDPPELAVRVLNAIDNAGFTVAQPVAVSTMTEGDWLRRKNVGRKTVHDLRRWLAHYGLEMQP
jgi:DNA-directed RNA polymerase alpha subunit